MEPRVENFCRCAFCISGKELLDCIGMGLFAMNILGLIILVAEGIK
jgi:hypothetical protein